MSVRRVWQIPAQGQGGMCLGAGDKEGAKGHRLKWSRVSPLWEQQAIRSPQYLIFLLVTHCSGWGCLGNTFIAGVVTLMTQRKHALCLIISLV